MFTPLILACTIDFAVCSTISSSKLFETEEECLLDVLIGYRELRDPNIIVIDAKCFYWDSPIFDPAA